MIEELVFYDMGFAEGIDPRLLSYEEYWGPHYFFDECEKTGKIKRNYFIAKLEKHARYALPLIKNIKHWM